MPAVKYMLYYIELVNHLQKCALTHTHTHGSTYIILVRMHLNYIYTASDFQYTFEISVHLTPHTIPLTLCSCGTQAFAQSIAREIRFRKVFVRAHSHSHSHTLVRLPCMLARTCTRRIWRDVNGRRRLHRSASDRDVREREREKESAVRGSRCTRCAFACVIIVHANMHTHTHMCHKYTENIGLGAPANDNV